jgi:protein TonB
LLLSLTVSAQDNQPIDDTTVFAKDKVDTMPDFPGGVDAFMKIMYKNYRVPNVRKNGTFKIYTSFIIEKDGSMTDVKVTNDCDKEFAAEAVCLFFSY